MKTYNYSNLTPEDIEKLCSRVNLNTEQVIPTVKTIIDEVKQRGDSALFEYTKQFDGVELTSLSVDTKGTVTSKIARALDQVAKNIRTFHQANMVQGKKVETMPGVTCWAESRAIDRVGLYIPSGSAPLVSTVLMLGIPAQLAGCKQVVLCAPPGANGSVDPAIVYAAELCGINQVFAIGGAQAVAAMAYGTETVPKVDKIFGPGNQYVTAAKQLVSVDPKGAAIDIPAGPTEALVVADDTAVPAFVAADLLSQAEHGPDSQVVLVTTSQAFIDEVLNELDIQIQELSRKGIAEDALKNSFIIKTNTIEEAIAFSNAYAPEHMLVQVDRAESYVSLVNNAGSVFTGNYACESAGDYASGTNHALPTYGYAKTYSGVSVASFQKQITFQTVSQQGAQSIGPTVMDLAELEGLDAHRQAMKLRTQL